MRYGRLHDYSKIKLVTSLLSVTTTGIHIDWWLAASPDDLCSNVDSVGYTMNNVKLIVIKLL